MKKLAALMMAVLCTLSVVACTEDSGAGANPDKESVESGERGETSDTEDDTAGSGNTAEPNDTETPDDPDEPETEEETASTEVYRRYPLLEDIYPFSDSGYAAFTVKKEYRLYYGYMDTKGDVIVEPTYLVESTPPLLSNVCLKNTTPSECIVDLKGNVLVEVGKENVTGIGEISNGYFWVEFLLEETVAGSVYQVDYYSAVTLERVATFPGARAFHDSYLNWSSYNACDSEVTKDGYALVIWNYDGNKEYQEIHMGDFDENYQSTEKKPWPIDLTEVPEFSGAENVHACASGDDEYSPVVIQSGSGVHFYAVVDARGNVTMKPQKAIGFSNSAYFRHGLCPAMDMESQLWGYVNVQGEWVIQPIYASVSKFSNNGLATVNERIVIDATGKVVIAPVTWTGEILTSLEGTYVFTGTTTYTSLFGEVYTLVFTKDGQMECRQKEALSTYKLNYVLQGYSITVDNLIPAPSSFPIFRKDGGSKICSISLKGNILTIGNTTWKLVEE